MSLKYQVLTCSQDSRYPQDLVLTLRFDGEAPDADAPICLIDAAPDLLGALDALLSRCESLGIDGIGPQKVAARQAIAKARSA